MNQLPTDFSILAIQDRVAPALGLTLPQLLELDFPPHDYVADDGRFWRAEKVRDAVIAITRGEFVSRPDELRELVQLVRLLRRASGKLELADDEARESALQHMTVARLRRVFEDWPSAA